MRSLFPSFSQIIPVFIPHFRFHFYFFCFLLPSSFIRTFTDLFLFYPLNSHDTSLAFSTPLVTSVLCPILSLVSCLPFLLFVCPLLLPSLPHPLFVLSSLSPSLPVKLLLHCFWFSNCLKVFCLQILVLNFCYYFSTIFVCVFCFHYLKRLYVFLFCPCLNYFKYFLLLINLKTYFTCI